MSDRRPPPARGTKAPKRRAVAPTPGGRATSSAATKRSARGTKQPARAAVAVSASARAAAAAAGVPARLAGAVAAPPARAAAAAAARIPVRGAPSAASKPPARATPPPTKEALERRVCELEAMLESERARHARQLSALRRETDRKLAAMVGEIVALRHHEARADMLARLLAERGGAEENPVDGEIAGPAGG